MERIETLGLEEMDQAALLNTGGGCDWICPVFKAAGAATRAVGEFLADGLSRYENPRYNGTWMG